MTADTSRDATERRANAALPIFNMAISPPFPLPVGSQARAKEPAP